MDSPPPVAVRKIDIDTLGTGNSADYGRVFARIGENEISLRLRIDHIERLTAATAAIVAEVLDEIRDGEARAFTGSVIVGDAESRP